MEVVKEYRLGEYFIESKRDDYYNDKIVIFYQYNHAYDHFKNIINFIPEKYIHEIENHFCEIQSKRKYGKATWIEANLEFWL